MGKFDKSVGIVRLRAMKHSGNVPDYIGFKLSKYDRDYTVGIALGEKWALEGAYYDELERVAGLDITAMDDGSVSFYITQAIAGDFIEDENGRPDEHEVCGMMKKLVGFQKPSKSLAVGFIQGALNVFEQV
jgi:hypothetical protein